MALAPQLVGKVGCVVDLSAAYRLKDASLYPGWYGFTHDQPALLAEAVFAQATPVGAWKTIDDETKKEKSLVRISETGGVLSVKVEKLNPKTELIYYGTVHLESRGHEETVIRFTLDEDGNVGNVNTEPKPLVGQMGKSGWDQPF